MPDAPRSPRMALTPGSLAFIQDGDLAAALTAAESVLTAGAPTVEVSTDPAASPRVLHLPLKPDPVIVDPDTYRDMAAL